MNKYLIVYTETKEGNVFELKNVKLWQCEAVAEKRAINEFFESVGEDNIYTFRVFSEVIK